MFHFFTIDIFFSLYGSHYKFYFSVPLLEPFADFLLTSSSPSFFGVIFFVVILCNNISFISCWCSYDFFSFSLLVLIVCNYTIRFLILSKTCVVDMLWLGCSIFLWSFWLSFPLGLSYSPFNSNMVMIFFETIYLKQWTICLLVHHQTLYIFLLIPLGLSVVTYKSNTICNVPHNH